MKYSSLLLVVLLCVVSTTGCRGSRDASEALEQELRFQEKKIWTYTSYIEDYQRLLDECRAENEALRERLGDDDGDRPLRNFRSRDDDDSDADTDPDIRVPEIEIPLGERQPDGDGPLLHSTSRPPRQLSPPAEESDPSGRQPSPAELAENSVLQQDPSTEIADSQLAPQDSVEEEALDIDLTQVEELSFNNLFTGGNNTDGLPGDEGISLLVETRNAEGDVVLPEGMLDISLMDPSAANESEARVGLWRLSADQIRERFRRADVGRGVRLKLPWQRGLPKREKLRLFVRFTRPDGERIRIDRDLEIELPGRSAAQRREKRRRLVASLFDRTKRSSENGNQDTRLPNPGASSAPLWQGGGASSAPPEDETASVTDARSKEPRRLGPAASGWSRSRRQIPTHPTPKRSLEQDSLQPEEAEPVAEPSPRKSPPVERSVTEHQDSRSAGSRSREPKEPKIAIRETDAGGSEPAERTGSRSDRAAERTAIKPRPWSPYR